jgi:hypothetical protein
MATILLPPKVVVASLVATIALTEKRRQSVRMRIMRMFIMHLLSKSQCGSRLAVWKLLSAVISIVVPTDDIECRPFL